MGNDRNKASWTSDARRIPGLRWACNLGKTGRDRCCSKIVGVVIAIRGMVLIAFLHDKAVVCETEPTVFMATTFTCHKYQHRDISAKTVE